MIIDRVETWWEAIPLSRPYRIAHHETESVELGFVRVVSADGAVGFGCAAPVEGITGESGPACRRALERMCAFSGDPATIRASLLPDFRATPAARAALDMALFDANGRSRGVPFVSMIRRPPDVLPTSVTLGIRSVDDTLAEADEYLARGFTVLKIKIGEHFDQDLERIARIRERVGRRIVLRADANQGYEPSQVESFFKRAHGVQFLEQPCPRERDDELRRLPLLLRLRLAADESLIDERDALRLVREPRPFGIWNIKLMKCGGMTPAIDIALTAGQNNVDLMWGCMDESVVSIAAALHAAYVSRRTHYLDLDGSFDLERDPFRGGFELRDGRLHTLGAPGLGVERNA